MNYFGIDFSTQQSSGFSIQMPSRQRPSDAPEITQPSTIAESTRSSQSNVLSGNFVHAAQEESRYIAGLKKGLDLQKSFMGQMQSVVAGYRNVLDLAASVGVEMSYAERNLLGKEAADAIETLTDKEVSDTNEENLDAMRDEVEEKVDEATASESEKNLENETAPQEALEESLEETTPAAQADMSSTTEDAPEEAVQAAEPPATEAAEAPTAATIDITV